MLLCFESIDALVARIAGVIAAVNGRTTFYDRVCFVDVVVGSGSERESSRTSSILFVTPARRLARPEASQTLFERFRGFTSEVHQTNHYSELVEIGATLPRQRQSVPTTAAKSNNHALDGPLLLLLPRVQSLQTETCLMLVRPRR